MPTNKGKLNPEYGIAVFTDGSASTHDRSGGWAWVAVDAFGNIEGSSGYESDTTISRMEIKAVEEALIGIKELYGSQEVLVYSDSQYVVLGINKNHKRHKNKDSWRALDAALRYHSHVELEHVKGHDGNEYNELADELAVEARKKIGTLASEEPLSHKEADHLRQIEDELRTNS